MHNKYIVAYDISDAKRLRNVYNFMRGYGKSIQYSIFLCELSLKEKAILKTEIYELIKPSEDSIILVDLGHGKSKKIETIGIKKASDDRGAIII